MCRGPGGGTMLISSVNGAGCRVSNRARSPPAPVQAR